MSMLLRNGMEGPFLASVLGAGCPECGTHWLKRCHTRKPIRPESVNLSVPMPRLSSGVSVATMRESRRSTPRVKERKKYSRLDLVEYPVVVAIDPGKTTGWSVMMVHPEALTDPEVSILANIDPWIHGEIDCTDENFGIEALDELIGCWPGAAVVFESFSLRKFSSDDDLLSPVRINATLGYLRWRCAVRVFYQSSEMALRTATDARLKLWGMYESEGGLVHARDADRHGITFLRRAKTIPRLRNAAWPYIYG